MKKANSVLLPYTSSLILVILTAVAAQAFLPTQENSTAGRESQRKNTTRELPEQRPPLPIHPGDKCYLADASALLNKTHYESQGYRLFKLKLEPLILEETINLSRSLELRIEQRGCADIYAKFTFTFKGGADQPRGIQKRINKAAQALKTLKINSGALLDFQNLTEIAKTVEGLRHGTPQYRRVVCLQKVGKECIRDVSLGYAFPQLQILYIDRP
jgi:hypothetical protein